ncbi:phosphatase PAP2 family protein [Kocuria sp. CPCC 205316]|uniref:phosphatase PAP2 family protein n=1 Tax=Kocuria TaxID=57493 RepID=UPI0036DD8E34
MKVVVGRPRPRGVALCGQLQEVGPHSLPSAHAAIGAGIACAVVLVFCWPRGTVARGAGILLGLGFAVTAGWSRVYLGVHHPGDVLGSIGLTVAAALIWLPVLARLLQPPGHDKSESRQ